MAARVVCALLVASASADAALMSLPQAPSAAFDAPAADAFGRLPLHFEPARSPVGATNAFVAVAAGHALRIEADAIRSTDTVTGDSDSLAASARGLALRFEGANAGAPIFGEQALEGRSHYFNGFDPAQVRLDVPHFARVRVARLYRGIDLVYHAHGRDLEYDLVLAPGADPGRIRIRFEGAERVVLDRAGDLIASAGGRSITQHRPVVYQELDGRRVAVEASYVALGKARFGVRLARFDRTRPLVIDPVLVYSTALAGRATEAAAAIAVDAAGNAYVAGWTSSSNFPTVNAYDSRLANGDRDVYVAKLNASGTALIYSTFLGGSRAEDFATGLAIDAQGNAYVTGTTAGNDFPVTAGAYRPAPATGGGAFVSKLGPLGNTLVYSTYVPFASNTRIAVDGAGRAIVCGQAADGFATTPGAFQTAIRTQSGGAPFALKLDTAGSAALFATILGGSGIDTFKAMELDGSGNIYLAGTTTSPDFPLMTPLQSSLQGGTDGFVAKLDATGTALVYSTYLGGTLDDSVNAIAVDQSGNAYLAGVTYSPNFPTRNPFQLFKAGFHLVNSSLGNAFVAKLSDTGNALVYASYLGGEICYPGFCQSSFGAPQIPGDAAYGIAVDNRGHALVTGVAKTYTFPLIDSRLGQKQQDSEWSVFVIKVSMSGSALVYSSLIHRGYDTYDARIADVPPGAGHAIALDAAGNAYLALQGLGDFPTTPGAFQSTTSIGHTFAFKLSSGALQLAVSTTPSPSTAGAPTAISASLTGAGAGTVSFMDGGGLLGSGPVVGGNASLSSNLPAGIRRLSAIYRDGSAESDSPTLHHVVNPRTTCP
jgi:hypothetical protein